MPLASLLKPYHSLQDKDLGQQTPLNITDALRVEDRKTGGDRAGKRTAKTSTAMTASTRFTPVVLEK